MYPVPRRSRGISKATRLLRDAASSPCPSCGRDTKTTSDGVCADCWAHKDGRTYGTVKPPPGWLALLLGRRRR